MKPLTTYRTEILFIGADSVRQVQSKFYTTDESVIIPLGVSFFAYGTLIDKILRSFGRVDYFNPDIDFSNDRVYSNAENYYDQIFVTAGLLFKDFKIQPNIRLIIYNDTREIAVDRKAEL